MTDADTLKTLIPINSLTPENFRELLGHTRIEQHPAGRCLFDQGDNDSDAIYLLSGEVALAAGQSSEGRLVSAGTDEARYALAHLKPRQYRGESRSPVTLVRVDGAVLDRLLTFDQAAGYEVTEFDGAEDSEWMFRMLRHPALQKLPPANINALFARLVPVAVKAGQVVIRQGEPGDYYYIIKTGRVSVSRKAGKSAKVVLLNELGEGDGFGEEALLAGAPRNANVIMLTDGVLMRLDRKDFDELLKDPLVQWVSPVEVAAMVQAGAGLIDVRLEDEFRRGAIRGSVNMPLYLLRLKAASLDPKRKYIVYCETGSRSCAAAFLLSQRGLDVYVLRGGLDAVTPAA
jgi:CRP-like cAMP-binding protein